jgi:hypothetical protein
MRKLNELPSALINAKMASEIVQVLTDLYWVEATCSAGLIHELIDDYHIAVNLVAHGSIKNDQ